MTFRAKTLTDASNFVVKNPRAGQVIGVIIGSLFRRQIF